MHKLWELRRNEEVSIYLVPKVETGRNQYNPTSHKSSWTQSQLIPAVDIGNWFQVSTLKLVILNLYAVLILGSSSSKSILSISSLTF